MAQMSICYRADTRDVVTWRTINEVASLNWGSKETGGNNRVVIADISSIILTNIETGLNKKTDFRVKSDLSGIEAK